jgi:hypothetical protein
MARIVDAEFEKIEQAFGSSLFRHLAVLPLWGLRLMTGPVWVLGVDLVLAILYTVWVNAPLKIALGSRFARQPHWSAFAELPRVMLLLVASFDCLHAFAG